jgi:predicted porin
MNQRNTSNVPVVAGILALLGPLTANAQSSVSIYGVADAAIAIENTGAPAGARRVAVNSGNQSSSRLGFRGVEDLGDGLRAVFNVEAGLNLDSGATDAAFFGRRSIVGLEGGFGALTLGREYTPIAAVAAATDIFGQGFFGSNLSAFAANGLSRRLSNSVNYKTPSFGGLRGSLVYSLGEQAAAQRLGNVLGGAVEYTSGAMYLGGGYHTVERLSMGEDKEYAIGAGYNFGRLDVKANYLVAEPAGSNKFEQINLGASIPLGTGRFFANLQRNTRNTLPDGARATAFAFAYAYPLSKRTNFYTSYAKMRNNATGSFGLSSSSTSVPSAATGADPSVLALGLRHTF